jgi:hypothetical protein
VSWFTVNPRHNTTKLILYYATTTVLTPQPSDNPPYTNAHTGIIHAGQMLILVVVVVGTEVYCAQLIYPNSFRVDRIGPTTER